MPITTIATARHALLAMLVPAVVAGGGCRPSASSPPIAVVDLIKELERADRRPAGAYSIADHDEGGTIFPSIIGPVPGRITWVLPLPRHGAFRASIAASTASRVRVGVSDGRIYEMLAAVALEPQRRWETIAVDLSAYAGRKWSLFYQPEHQAWRLNLSIDGSGPSGGVALGRPEIVAPAGADAVEYAQRRARLTRSGAP